MSHSEHLRDIETHIIEIAGREIVLRGDGCAIDRADRTLYVADIHLGKAETFQRRGRAVPLGGDAQSFHQLAQAVNESLVESVVVLGDLFHAPRDLRPEQLCELLERLNRHADRPITLVLGNHDRLPRSTLEHYGITVVDEPYVTDHWQCLHHPPVDFNNLDQQSQNDVNPNEQHKK